MIISIHQPAYLPWLGYFDKIAHADSFVLLDSVQFEKNSFDNRNKIRTKDGWVWLTVPVKTKGRFGNNSWLDLEIDNCSNWKDKHFKSIKMSYSKAPFWNDHEPFLASIYSREFKYLIDLNLEMLEYYVKYLNIKTQVIRASSYNFTKKKSDLVLEILEHFKATTYYSGRLGLDYLDQKSFSSQNIQLVFQNYNHPVYEQIYPGFQPFMSILDLIMMKGKQSSDFFLGTESIFVSQLK